MEEVGRATVLPLGPRDYEAAATLYRTCRRAGETVRTLVDCLPASVAIREDVAVLDADTDFGAIARHTSLALHGVRR